MAAPHQVRGGHIRARHDRNRDEGTEDPAEQQSGRDRQNHGQRVDPHRASEQQRLQDMALELHDPDDHAQQDQGDYEAVRDQRDQHRNQAGDERSDDRDEGAEEDQRRQRYGQRDPQDQQSDADDHRVEQSHGGGRPYVGDQRPPRPAGRLVDRRPGRSGEQPVQPTPDAAAVLQEEEQGEQGQCQAGDDVTHRHGGGQRAAGQQVLVVGQRFLRTLECVIELGLGQ